jgi:hypothetical protein
VVRAEDVVLPVRPVQPVGEIGPLAGDEVSARDMVLPFGQRLVDDQRGLAGRTDCGELQDDADGERDREGQVAVLRRLHPDALTAFDDPLRLRLRPAGHRRARITDLGLDEPEGATARVHHSDVEVEPPALGGARAGRSDALDRDLGAVERLDPGDREWVRLRREGGRGGDGGKAENDSAAIASSSSSVRQERTQCRSAVERRK